MTAASTKEQLERRPAARSLPLFPLLSLFSPLPPQGDAGLLAQSVRRGCHYKFTSLIRVSAYLPTPCHSHRAFSLSFFPLYSFYYPKSSVLQLTLFHNTVARMPCDHGLLAIRPFPRNGRF